MKEKILHLRNHELKSLCGVVRSLQRLRGGLVTIVSQDDRNAYCIHYYYADREWFKEEKRRYTMCEECQNHPEPQFMLLKGIKNT